jgi:hypothetical protein
MPKLPRRLVYFPAAIRFSPGREPRFKFDASATRKSIEAVHHVRRRNVAPVDDSTHRGMMAAKRKFQLAAIRRISHAGKTINIAWTTVSTGLLRSPITTNQSAIE